MFVPVIQRAFIKHGSKVVAPRVVGSSSAASGRFQNTSAKVRKAFDHTVVVAVLFVCYYN